ncbi:Asp/Glu racemase [Acetobacteraceae bacterium H6797]|nr:Asp/Glu racemase [Acetobacteraceae bacterium H6797]
MRILLLNGNTGDDVTALMMRRGGEALPRLRLAHVELVPATARFGARYIATRAASAIAGHAVLELVAEHQDVDAIGIACFGDPGLFAAREISRVPVRGMAEASIEAALALAPRVALLTGGALWVPMLEEFAALLGHSRETVMVRHVAPTGDMIARDPDGAIALLAEAARGAIAEGAGAIVLGGAGLVGLAPRVADGLGVPVLDSLDCLLAACAKAAPTPPRDALPAPASPSRGLAEPLRAALGKEMDAGFTAA